MLRVALLIALCAGPAFAAEPPRVASEPAPLLVADGDEPFVLPLGTVVTLATRASPGDERRLSSQPVTWRREGARLVAALDDAASGVRAQLALADNFGAWELTADVRYTQRVWLEIVALDLTLPGRAEALDRDFTMRPVSSVAYLDRFATKKVRVGPVTLLVDDTVDGVVARRAGEGGKPTTEVRVEIFASEARPFHHCSTCKEDWRSDNPKLTFPVRLREAGEHDTARVELHGDDGPVLVKERFPDGRPATLVITDHADQSAPDTFTALARGRSDTVRPVGGLLGHRLVITKSLFLRGELNGEGRRQLEDMRVWGIAEEMAAQGSEIIPHSVTPNADDRAETAAGLDRFDRFHSVTWIDHQPETNCEAFTNEGWCGPDGKDAARYRIADLLAQHGYRYIWSAIDQNEIDLLGARHFERRALSLWPVGRLAVGDPDNRWLFKTSWLLVDRDRFFHALGESSLDTLERDHGLAILHTYLEALHEGDNNPRFANRNVLRKIRGGVVETWPKLEDIFSDLRRRIDRGSLWMPTLAGLGDWLRGLDGVRVRYERDGTARVVSEASLTGVTFRVPVEVEVLVDGAPPRGLRREKDGTVFWFDLSAHKPVKVSLTAGRRPIYFLARARADEPNRK